MYAAHIRDNTVQTVKEHLENVAGFDNAIQVAGRENRNGEVTPRKGRVN